MCDLIPPSDEWCCLSSECEKYSKGGKEAYFKEVPKPLSEEYHSLREWAQILATNSDLRAEFDKLCPPQPIQGSIAPEADLEAEVDKYLVENYTNDTDVDTPFLERMFSHDRNDLVQFARHFAEWGRKKVLQEIHDGKYKVADKHTAVWLEDE